MASDRKGVLLRFPPDLLELVDEQRGVQDRTPFLLDLIRAGLDTDDEAAGCVYGYDGSPVATAAQVIAEYADGCP